MDLDSPKGEQQLSSQVDIPENEQDELNDDHLRPSEMEDSEMLDNQSLDQELEARQYDLRLSTRLGNAIMRSTWMDQDDTGDYDPIADRHANRARRARTHQRLAASRAELDGRTDIEHGVQMEEEPLVPLILKFTSPETCRVFQAKVSTYISKLVDPAPHSAGRYALRGRVSDPQHINLNLTGHPRARGCWGCYQLHLDCSLLHDERDWPCANCVEDSQDCDLITPPVRKQACERCKRNKEPCSLPSEADQSRPCQSCQMSNFHCVAGPDRDYIPLRARYDRDLTADPKPLARQSNKSTNGRALLLSALKTKWSCLECQYTRRTCSFFYETSPGDTCTACEMQGNEQCIPVDLSTTAPLPPPQPLRPPKIKPAVSQIHSRDLDCTIRTRFRHPVTFNHAPSAVLPCTFCAQPSFGILGHPAQTRRVVRLSNGCGYDELPACPEAARTRMCVACTTTRLFMVTCERHEFRALYGDATLGIPLTEHTAALHALFADCPRPTDRWCSVCPSLAEFECVTDGVRGLAAPAVQGDTGMLGCGLGLCRVCMTTFRRAKQSSRAFQDMLSRLQPEPGETRPLGLRADWDLLREDGFLMRAVMGSSR